MDLAIIIAVVVVALVFDYTNGFHDAANAIATSVSTRALTPRVALAMAAVANLCGAFFGKKVADQLYRRTVARLFSGQYDALTAMKLKDLADELEAAADSLEDVADTVETISVKES